ncbi:MliC family protein [Colwellia sp. E2M01]|uniref:MliC family protein n=1 Tax=Colwellia sp. E2M01 TaxID=2841561 RepID=UPI001C082329|nr:MliC family protein [Colwellia sp. E2M01]MBU2869866.1 MliC family protein [Colwellia sp. E2M01]
MNKVLFILTIIVAFWAATTVTKSLDNANQELTENTKSSEIQVITEVCSSTWQHNIDQKVITGDGAGHGPDIGSDEWQSVIEFKLGVRGEAKIPDRNSNAWCVYIEDLVQQQTTDSTTNSLSQQVKPSFVCDHTNINSVEEIICESNELATLDNQLAITYREALNISAETKATLEATQRGWIKGRNECWKNDNKSECINTEYLHRIANLQAQYKLAPHSEPVTFTCENDTNNEIVVTFFETNPATLIAERGDSIALMYIQPSASGSKYQGRNETFWEHQGEAMVTWGYKAPKLHCKKAL